MTTTLDMATIQRGARVRRSPFFNSTVKEGCWSYTVYNHMFLPTGYDDLEKNIGYAMVPIDLSTVGSTFVVATPNGDRQATVVEKPFVDPKKAVPKS